METKETILAKLNTSPTAFYRTCGAGRFLLCAERNYAGAVSGHKTVL